MEQGVLFLAWSLRRASIEPVAELARSFKLKLDIMIAASILETTYCRVYQVYHLSCNGWGDLAIVRWLLWWKALGLLEVSCSSLLAWQQSTVASL